MLALVLSLGSVLALGPAVPVDAAVGGGVAGPRRDGTVSPDGLTIAVGPRTLRVAQATDLAPGGQQVAVAGSGYDTEKGIYVALCLVTPADQPPSPCGGGIDIDGVSGASAWISSNPPSYGEGLAVPYGAGGTFSVTVSASPVLAGGFDCRQVQCAIVTRNDHVRTADRSQDLLIPVRFAPGEAPAPPTVPPVSEPPATTAPATTAPPTTLAPPPAPTTVAPDPAPEATLSSDGRTARSGDRSLTASEVEGLASDGDVVTVDGEGFDDTVGVLVSLCRTSDDPTRAPSPCFAGSTPLASRWISSSPPEFAPDTVVPYDAGGAFSVELDVAAVLDETTDCRETECALVVRRDDTDADDRSLDLALPVSFATEASPRPTTDAALPASAAGGAEDDGGGASPLPWVVGIVVLGALVGAGLAMARRRRCGAGGEPVPSTASTQVAGEAP